MNAVAPVVDHRARAEVLGVKIDALSLAETVDRAEQLILAGGCHHHLSVNAAKLVLLNDDSELQAIAEDASLVSADGMAVVWAARLLRKAIPARVTGIDLMGALLERAARRGYSVYLLGATPAVVEEASRVLRGRHPGLVVVGWRDGYWDDDAEPDVVAEIAAVRPTILLVALPTPQKERFVARQLDALGVPFVMGVGGSFDIVAGTTRRAPAWMQRIGMEWLYRLAQEPRRMWRRYLVGNSRFVMLVLWAWCADRRHLTE